MHVIFWSVCRVFLADFSVTAEGTHTFDEVNKAGRYVELKRMSGISTTDIIQRFRF